MIASLFENTPGKNLHHTDPNQPTRAANQKPTETLEMNTKCS